LQIDKLRIVVGTFLFKVEDRFMISGRGLILTPGLGDKWGIAKTGTEIKLIRPDKSEIKTRIHGVTFEGQHDILVSPELTKDQVPVGTEVWTT